jgi:hypothetical protein
MATVDFVAVGFPDCGTGLLGRQLEKFTGVNIDKLNGNVEAPFYMNDRDPQVLKRQQPMKSSSLNGHCYSAYIYDQTALKRIKTDNPNAVFVICVREPIQALMSWREMHRGLAEKGTPATHFVNKTRESRKFYVAASLDEYHEAYAEPRLKFTARIKQMLRALNNPKTVIVSQDAIKKRSATVAEAIFSSVSDSAFGKDRNAVALRERLSLGLLDGTVKDFQGSPKLVATLSDELSQLNTLFFELSAQKHVLIVV